MREDQPRYRLAERRKPPKNPPSAKKPTV